MSSILYIQSRILLDFISTANYSGLCDSIKYMSYSGQKENDKCFVRSQHMTTLNKSCCLMVKLNIAMELLNTDKHILISSNVQSHYLQEHSMPSAIA